MNEYLSALSNFGVQVFAISSMASVGLTYTVKEILSPLRNVWGVALALIANFLAVPALAWGVTRLIPLEASFQVGLLIVALAAGAPFAIKLTRMARGTVAFTSGILVLLLVTTIVYLPFVLPRVLPDADVAAGGIAWPLFLTMLLPLTAGLALKALAPGLDRVCPFLGKLANVSLVLVVVLSFLLNLETVLGVFGTGAILVSLLVVVGAAIFGWLLGAFGAGLRDEMALVTAQRNYAAAMVVATQSFGRQPGVLVMVVILSLVSMVILFPAAKWLGNRAEGKIGSDGRLPPSQRAGA